MPSGNSILISFSYLINEDFRCSESELLSISLNINYFAFQQRKGSLFWGIN